MEWNRVEVEGEAPPPRWRHTANVIDKTRILIFGGFHSRSVRLNDVWVLDTLKMQWECLHHGERPPSDHTYKHVVELDREANAKAAGGLAGGEDEDEDEEGGGEKPKAEGAVVGGTEDASNEITGTPPFPRGGHTASQIGNSLYVFGGYGGSGYGRRDFNDLWSLNLASLCWERHVTKGAPGGAPPRGRSRPCWGSPAAFADRRSSLPPPARHRPGAALRPLGGGCGEHAVRVRRAEQRGAVRRHVRAGRGDADVDAASRADGSAVEPQHGVREGHP